MYKKQFTTLLSQQEHEDLQRITDELKIPKIEVLRTGIKMLKERLVIKLIANQS